MRLIIRCSIIMGIAMLLCGCPKKVEKPEVKTLPYDLHRPEWIYNDGTEGIPEVIMGKMALSVAECGDSVWFGVYGYGMAEYDLTAKKWNLLPLDIREVAVSGIGCSETKIYAGVSGRGIMEIDKKTREMHLYKNGTVSEINRFIDLVYYGGKAWVSTIVGLYVFDTSKKNYQLVTDKRCKGLALADEKIVVALDDKQDRTIMEYDAITAEEIKRMAIPGEVQVVGTLKFFNKELYLVSNNGITKINPDTGDYKFYDGFEYLGKSRVGKLAYYDGFVITGTDNGLLILDLSEGKWTLAGVESGAPAGMISAIVSSGGYLFLAADIGPFVFSQETFKQAMYLAKLHSDAIESPGKTGDEISREQSSYSKWINVNERSGLLNNSVYSLLMTREDIWVGTSISGLNRISMEDYSVKTYMMEGDAEKGFYHPVMELAKYGDSLFHAGYAFYGEFNIPGEKWVRPVRQYSDSKNLDSEGLYVDDDGIVMAVRKEGLRFRKRDEKEWEKVDAAYLNTSPFMTDIIRVRGTYYISMDAGVQKFNLEKKLFRYLETGLLDIKCLAADGSSLWIGAKERNVVLGPQNTGLYRFNIYSGDLVGYHVLPEAKATHINDIEVDGPLIWVASEQGLFRLNRLTGEWNSFAGLPDIPPGRVNAISVYADTVAAGTDAGVFIKKIFLFQTDAVRDRYREAWELEKRGEFAKAAELYGELEKIVGDSMKKYLEFRRADCFYNDGNLHDAKAVYEYLLEDHPLLIADLENLFVELYEYDSYVRALLRTEADYDEGTPERRYCSVHLLNTPLALLKVGERLEKDGKKERAEDYWKLILELPDSLNGIAEAKEEARKKIKT